MGLGDTSDGYFDQEHFETNQRSLRLPVQTVMVQFIWFMCLVTLTFDLCSIFVRRTRHEALESGISMRSFIRIGQILMGDTAAEPHTHARTQTL